MGRELDLHGEYDADADAVYIKISPVERITVDMTVDLEDTALGLPVLIDLDEDRRVVGIEILNAARVLGLQR